MISAELIHGTTGERLWGQTFDRPSRDLMRVQDSIVASIAEGLRLRLSGEEKARLSGFGTSDPAAYELLLKGRFLMQRDTEEDEMAARKLFMQAIDTDPNFVDAYLALASSYERERGRRLRTAARDEERCAQEALAKARRSIRATPRCAWRWRLNGSGRRRTGPPPSVSIRAVMYDPVVLRTAQYHPIALFFVAIGRPDDAVTLVERALVVDPGNLESRAMLGNFLLQAGRLDEALRVYNAFAAEEPDDPRPLFGAADVYKRRGDFARASEARRKAYELEGDDDSALVFQRASSEADFAKAELAIAKAALETYEELAKQRFVQPFDIARLHAQVGNREQALAGLERIADDGYIGLTMLKVDQAWDSVRADPRFAAIVRKVGIP